MEQIRILYYPEPGQFLTWKQALRQEIEAASPDPDKAWAWICELEQAGVGIEYFAYRGRKKWMKVRVMKT